ncbi:RNA polymerase sigma-70 factor [Prolixibacteraceae bacterium JC049]|nr:RNA polymerase sigma-70 factor [Prolixibacteraceae bacterium JC049]
MGVEDRILINQIRQQNKVIFEALFKEYYQPLLRLAESYVFNKQACEDIVQGVFIYLWENANRIEINNSIKAYLQQSIRYKCLNYIRQIDLIDSHQLMYIDSILQAEEIMEDCPLFEDVKSAIDQLPKEMQRVFRLKYLDSKKNREISDMLNISENTVKTQLKRATSKLRVKFKNTMNLLCLSI